MSKALKMLNTAKSVSDRAEAYAPRIKESLKLKIIRPLKERIAVIDDKIFDLSNFALDTDLNRGQKQMSKEDCEKRFEEIIELSYEKDMLEMELESKQETFDDLFGEESDSED